MTWDGIERRQVGFCEDHIGMSKSVAVIEKTLIDLDKRINGSLKSIEKHMDDGIRWRIAIMGVAAILVVQFVGFIIFFSRVATRVEINTERVFQLECLHPRLDYK